MAKDKQSNCSYAHVNYRRTSGLLRPQPHKSSTTLEEYVFGGLGNVSRGKTRFFIISSCVDL